VDELRFGSPSIMKIHLKDFRVPARRQIDLSKWPTDIKPLYHSHEYYKEHLAQDAKEIGELQRTLYASASHAVLLIFQATDAAGKDGAISHVLSKVHPQGCIVSDFKHPSAEELTHDFLWRTTRRLPARGMIGVFNRSYYEEVLVVREHPAMFRQEDIPHEKRGDQATWKGRYRSINDLEAHLHRNGTLVVKLFLHLSKDEQRKRFLARIDEAGKNWKFSDADVAERAFWDQYATLYQDCLHATSTKGTPWYVVPADDKLNARLIISRIVIEALRSLNLSYPLTTSARRHELQAIRKKLVNE
jgi:PPK2 family polyphosphate:nucleotide phosphotransferase